LQADDPASRWHGENMAGHDRYAGPPSVRRLGMLNSARSEYWAAGLLAGVLFAVALLPVKVKNIISAMIHGWASGFAPASVARDTRLISYLQTRRSAMRYCWRSEQAAWLQEPPMRELDRNHHGR